MRKIAVTLTTINKPTVLERLLKIQRDSEIDATFDYIIVGDRKTPNGVAEYVEKLNKEFSTKIVYFDLNEQKHHFGHLTAIWNHVPADSFSRRNFGDLYAYREGYETIIRIDDDNYPTDNEFFTGHLITGTEREVTVVESDTGWYNICYTLAERDGQFFYPRGYPFLKRWKDGNLTTCQQNVKVAVHGGLWLGNPDVDAITRLCRPVEAVRYRDDIFGPVYALAPGTWCPINTQNTAFSRDTIPAAFVSPHAGRLNDIFMGYFLRKLIDHVGEPATYGRPLLDQDRNEHNLWRDLDDESPNRFVDRTMDVVRDINLKSTGYLASYIELIEYLRRTTEIDQGYFAPILEGMALWADIFTKDH